MSYYANTSSSRLKKAPPLYILHEDNQNYLNGQSRPGRGWLGPILFFGLAALFIAVGSLFLYSSLDRLLNLVQLNPSAVSAQARIIDHRSVAAGRNNQNYYLTYTFTVPQAASPSAPARTTTYKHTASVEAATYNQYPLNSLIGIVYLPDDPTVSDVPNQFDGMWLMIIGGIGFVGLGIVFTGLGVWVRRSHRLLAAKGQILFATAVSIEEIRLRGSIKGLNEKGSRISYRFAAPGGQLITKTLMTDNEIRPDICYDLLQRKAFLVVLYLNEHKFDLL